VVWFLTKRAFHRYGMMSACERVSGGKGRSWNSHPVVSGATLADLSRLDCVCYPLFRYVLLAAKDQSMPRLRTGGKLATTLIWGSSRLGTSYWSNILTSTLISPWRTGFGIRQRDGRRALASGQVLTAIESASWRPDVSTVKTMFPPIKTTNTAA
jgi:hypothetical protein